MDIDERSLDSRLMDIMNVELCSDFFDFAFPVANTDYARYLIQIEVWGYEQLRIYLIRGIQSMTTATSKMAWNSYEWNLPYTFLVYKFAW
jgi:hypothetical protein